MSKKTKAFFYNLVCFAILFVIFHYLTSKFSSFSGLWIPLIAFVISTILAPKFQAVRTKEGEKIFMRWLFIKGIKEIK